MIFRAGALQALERCRADVQSVEEHTGRRVVLHTGESFAKAVKETIGATVQIAKRSKLHTFKVMTKRWVVERFFAWLDKCRGLWKNCERKLNCSLQLLLLAFPVLLLKR